MTSLSYQQVAHTYELTVVDERDNLMDGVMIHFKVIEFDSIKEVGYGITDSLGIYSKTVLANPDPTRTYLKLYHTKLEYEVSRQDYNSESGTMYSMFSGESYRWPGKIEVKVILTRQPQHTYEIAVVDIEGNPLDNAKIHFKISEFDTMREEGDILTDSTGIFVMAILARSDPIYEYAKFYRTKLEYEVTKNGYYSKFDRMQSAFGGDASVGTERTIAKVKLLRPIDYFAHEFVTTATTQGLEERILALIDLFLLHAILTESTMVPQSIDMQEFKGKKYLTIAFSSNNVFNSLRQDKYDIGKKLFDNIVRKILDQLNHFISDRSTFYGYDIKIYGYSKNFAEENAIPDAIEYRFLIPKKFVTQYENKDISGQGVLDRSIILMDDERVEFQLQ